VRLLIPSSHSPARRHACRVYAYTTSPVLQSILRIFVRCDALLPNLFVGTLTRESVKSALEVGISAQQIVGFLRQHAHPRIASKSPIVPLVSFCCPLAPAVAAVLRLQLLWGKQGWTWGLPLCFIWSRSAESLQVRVWEAGVELEE
jgi:hypothetical protein